MDFHGGGLNVRPETAALLWQEAMRAQVVHIPPKPNCQVTTGQILPATIIHSLSQPHTDATDLPNPPQEVRGLSFRGDHGLILGAFAQRDCH